MDIDYSVGEVKDIFNSASEYVNDCEKKFFALAKHAIEVNNNYTEHNEKLAIRDLFKAGFSRTEISDTLEKYSPVSLRDKALVEKNIQMVEKNMKNTRGR